MFDCLGTTQTLLTEASRRANVPVVHRYAVVPKKSWRPPGLPNQIRPSPANDLAQPGLRHSGTHEAAANRGSSERARQRPTEAAASARGAQAKLAQDRPSEARNRPASEVRDVEACLSSPRQILRGLTRRWNLPMQQTYPRPSEPRRAAAARGSDAGLPFEARKPAPSTEVRQFGPSRCSDARPIRDMAELAQPPEASQRARPAPDHRREAARSVRTEPRQAYLREALATPGRQILPA